MPYLDELVEDRTVPWPCTLLIGSLMNLPLRFVNPFYPTLLHHISCPHT